MWFGSPEKNSIIPTNAPRSEGSGGIGQYNSSLVNPIETILQVISSTTCFDLMRNSSKVNYNLIFS